MSKHLSFVKEKHHHKGPSILEGKQACKYYQEHTGELSKVYHSNRHSTNIDANWKFLKHKELVPGVENLQVLNLANVPSLGQGPSEA